MNEQMHGIISLDDHVLEPPNIWVDRLPRKYRDIGPRVEYHPEATPALAEGAFVERPGADGKRCAWWHYEDQYSMRRQQRLTRMQMRRRCELLIEAPLNPMRLGRQPVPRDRANAPT